MDFMLANFTCVHIQHRCWNQEALGAEAPQMLHLLHGKGEMVVSTLLRLSQLQMNDFMCIWQQVNHSQHHNGL